MPVWEHVGNLQASLDRSIARERELNTKIERLTTALDKYKRAYGELRHG